MASTVRPIRSRFPAEQWSDDPPPATLFHPMDRDRETRRRSRDRRPFRALVIFGLGVAATLAWQSPRGDVARERIASAFPQLAWLAPQAADRAQAASNMVAPAGPATRDVQQLKTMSIDLAAVRQSLNQLTAGQQQMADGIARLQEADQDILNKISVAPPQPAAPPARKPAPATPPPVR